MLRRHDTNPILTRKDLPAMPPELVDPSSVFNPGALLHEGRIHLMLRVQARSRRTFLVMAVSDDGVRFQVADRPVDLTGISGVSERLYHVYDPRLTRVDDRILVLFAADTDHGCRIGVAETHDLRSFTCLGLSSGTDTRNAVLFPDRIDGKYLRLERPNRISTGGGPPTGDEIVLAESDDLLSWRLRGAVLRGRPHYFDELIGSGPPPLKTRAGWLHIYHGVATHFQSSNIYQAGAVLLDLKDPTRVLARTRENILEPREPYELVGQVPNVVFPSGMICRSGDRDGFADPDAEVLIYYGAADTCVGLATTTVTDLLSACDA